MNALPSELLRQAQELSESVTKPFTGSKKIYVQGSRDDIRVPMREIQLTDTQKIVGVEKNAPFCVYDNSGPYTDPTVSIDLAQGLSPLRAKWIEERNDTELLAGLSSEFGRAREHDAKLNAVRFGSRPLPRKAKAGMNVSQMHYARRGIITPEMEFIALRENQNIQVMKITVRIYRN